MATSPKRRNPVIEVTIKPGYVGGRFKVAFEGPTGIVNPKTGYLNFKEMPGPVDITFRLKNPDLEPPLWWSFLSRPPFNVFAFADDKDDEIAVIGKSHHQIHIRKVTRGGQNVEITYQNFSDRRTPPDESRYNVYLTRGSEPNIIYVVDPIIRNGGQLLR